MCSSDLQGGGGVATVTASTAIAVTLINSTPTVVAPLLDQVAVQGQAFSFQIPTGAFTDADAGDTLSYTTSTLPAWLSFDAATRTFSGTPQAGDAGTVTVTVTASDGHLGETSDSFTLTVSNDAPTVAAALADRVDLVVAGLAMPIRNPARDHMPDRPARPSGG